MGCVGTFKRRLSARLEPSKQPPPHQQQKRRREHRHLVLECVVAAFSAVGACLNNLGPGLGDVALNYASLGPEIKWLLMFTMVLGRLEIFTVLVLLTPAYWRR